MREDRDLDHDDDARRARRGARARVIRRLVSSSYRRSRRGRRRRPARSSWSWRSWSSWSSSAAPDRACPRPQQHGEVLQRAEVDVRGDGRVRRRCSRVASSRSRSCRPAGPDGNNVDCGDVDDRVAGAAPSFPGRTRRTRSCEPFCPDAIPVVAGDRAVPRSLHADREARDRSALGSCAPPFHTSITLPTMPSGAMTGMSTAMPVFRSLVDRERRIEVARVATDDETGHVLHEQTRRAAGASAFRSLFSLIASSACGLVPLQRRDLLFEPAVLALQVPGVGHAVPPVADRARRRCRRRSCTGETIRCAIRPSAPSGPDRPLRVSRVISVRHVSTITSRT